MTKKLRQKFKYLENKKSFWGEIKSIFHPFYRAFICQNLPQTWQCAFKDQKHPIWSETHQYQTEAKNLVPATEKYEMSLTKIQKTLKNY